MYNHVYTYIYNHMCIYIIIYIYMICVHILTFLTLLYTEYDDGSLGIQKINQDKEPVKQHVITTQ